MSSMVEQEDFTVRPGDMQAMTSRSAMSVLAELSAEEQAALMRFAQTPAFRKFSVLVTRVQEASAEWANETSPGLDARVEKTVADAATAFMAAADKPGSKN